MAKSVDDLFEELAKKYLRFETLTPRNRDSLDFRQVSIWDVKRALEAAYNEGVQEGARQMTHHAELRTKDNTPK